MYSEKIGGPTGIFPRWLSPAGFEPRISRILAMRVVLLMVPNRESLAVHGICPLANTILDPESNFPENLDHRPIDARYS